jgi:hypothetical protein
MGAFTYLNGVGTIQDFIRAVGFSSVIFFILKFYSLLDYDVNFPDDDFRGKSIKPINGPGHGKMVEPFIKKKNEKVL